MTEINFFFELVSELHTILKRIVFINKNLRKFINSKLLNGEEFFK